jgi:serine/threonine protein kinase
MRLALKVYEKQYLRSASRKRNVLREISILNKLQHPNILALFDVIDTSKQLYLVLEMVQGTSLLSFLKQTRPEQNDQVDTTVSTVFQPWSVKAIPE